MSEAKVLRLENEMSSYKESLHQINVEIAVLSEKFDNINKDILELDGKVDNLTTKIEELSTRAWKIILFISVIGSGVGVTGGGIGAKLLEIFGGDTVSVSDAGG